MSSCLGRYFFVNPKFLGNGLQLSVNDLVTLNVPEQTSFFLFMCFTSMHITDARMFCIEQVNNDVLTYYRVKNRNCKPEPIKIPMPVPAEKLLEEWAEGREEGRLFRNVL